MSRTDLILWYSDTYQKFFLSKVLPCALVAIIILISPIAATESNPTTASVTLMNLQVPFIQNAGQQPDTVQFYANTFYGTAYVTDNGITHAVAITKDNQTYGVTLKEMFVTTDGIPIPLIPQGKDSAGTKVSYFIGNDQNKWRSDLPTYNSVSLGEIYHDITVSTKAYDNTIEKIFTIAPHADPADIRIRVEGAKSIHIAEDGNLVIATDDGNVTMAAPKAFQEKQEVRVAYHILGDDIYGFAIGKYNLSQPLVIDPSLAYSCYLGGSGDERAYGVAADSTGTYVTGITSSSEFPTTPGAYKTDSSGNIFISKMNPAGTGLLYSTYLGGSGTEPQPRTGVKIAVDNSGNTYVTGSTASTDFPITPGAYQTSFAGGSGEYGGTDAFVSKINPDGTSLMYSSYLGGSSDDMSYGIAVDNSGIIYIDGSTLSSDFPITTGAYQTSFSGWLDAFACKINPAGQSLNDLVYSTYFGGSDEVTGDGIAIDNSGNIYIVGLTFVDVPVTSNAFRTENSNAWSTMEIYVSKINPAGQSLSDLVYSTYLGGGGPEDQPGYYIAVDDAGNAYITGYTSSTDFPITTNAYQTTNAGSIDAFLSKFSSDGTSLIYSTYLGRSGDEYANGIATDNSGNAYVTGYTGSSNFPTTTNAYQTTNAGSIDAFLSKFSSDGTSLIYSTYLGGSGDEYANGIVIDSSGEIYLTGYTGSSNFPTTTGVYQTTNNGGNDAFVTKFSFSTVSTLTAITLSPSAAALKQGETQKFTATAKDQYDSAMSEILFSWSSDNETVGAVDSSGLFTAVNTGIANITATNGTVSGKSEVTVTPATSDLAATAIDPGTPVVGQPSTVSVSVRNFGTAAVGTFNVALLANNTEINRTAVPSLGGRESRSVGILWTPSTATGVAVNLTAVVDPEHIISDTNPANNTVSKTITVGGPDLVITKVNAPLPRSMVSVVATITNQGNLDAGAFRVNATLYGNTTTFDVPGLAAGSTTTISVPDPIETGKYQDAIPITITLDTGNAIAETSEANNVYTTPVTIGTDGNYYDGGRAYSGYDLETGNYTEGHEALIYSSGNSGYHTLGQWQSVTVDWTSTDLPVPTSAKVKSARIYQSWTWGAHADTGATLRFNDNDIERAATYYEPLRDGDYTTLAAFEGQIVWDVTPYFNKNGNTAQLTAPHAAGGLYSTVLVVVYDDESEPYRKIWLDEGCDTLSAGSIPSTDEKRTGYAMFRNVTTTGASSAKVTTILPSGGDNSQGSIHFNGQTSLLKGTGGSDPGYKYYEVTGNLTEGTNELGVLFDGGFLNLAAAILELTYETPPSEVSFSANVTSGQAPVAVGFTDLSYGATGWHWDFDNDGTIDSTEKNPEYIFADAGTYTVNLKVTNAYGSGNMTKTAYITVTPPAPVANFTASAYSGPAPLTVRFTDTSTHLPTNWSWDFGDGNTSADQNPTHTYSAIGSYTVNFTVQNAHGSTFRNWTNCITVTDAASAAPSVTFTKDTDAGHVPLTVQFNDTSTGSPYLWSWDFGDGGTSADQNPLHTYMATGTYSVKLTTTGPGGSASRTMTNAVVAGAAPIADNYEGSIPLGTVKTGAVSGGVWTDSYPGFDKSATKTFTLPDHTAIRWARLYVTVYNGLITANYPGQVTIDIDPNGDNTYEITKQETFNTAYSYRGTGGTGRVWLNDHLNRVTSDYLMWYDLTGAISGNTVNVKARTEALGSSSLDGRIKMMTLVVAYDDGDQDKIYYWVNQGHDTIYKGNDAKGYTRSTTFSTSEAPTGWTSAMPANLTSFYIMSDPGNYTFRGSFLPTGTMAGSYFGTTTWPISSYLVENQDCTLTYTYTDSGSGYLKLPLAILTMRYPANSGPVAGFSAASTKGTGPFTVRFSDESAGSPTGWAWEFGDGDSTNATEKNPVHTYTQPGAYTVNLTITAGGKNSRITKKGYITVNSNVPPVASFAATAIAGSAPFTVQFTDASTNTPTAWTWDFGDYDSTNATERNPVHTYVAAGTYSVSLAATNAAGSSSYQMPESIRVTQPSGGNYDLAITGTVATKPAYVFAQENNTVQVGPIKNTGTSPSPATQVELRSSDGFVTRTLLPSLNASGTTTITIVDTKKRILSGDIISYTATIDPDSTLSETGRANNAQSSAAYTVIYNGYKGKMYWTGMSNISTYRTLDINGGFVNSSGTSEYISGTSGNTGGSLGPDWTSYAVSWSPGDLPVPNGSTIKEARLYVPYTWDNSNEAPDKIHIAFNGNSIPYENGYTDKSNFGSYADYMYGLITYDVTDNFAANGPNAATLSRDSPNSKISFYGLTLVVVYENPSSTRKQIFMNEDFDLLSADEAGYGTTPQEATAYVPFSGMTVDTADIGSASLITFVPSGDSYEGSLLFNGNTVANNVWSYGTRAVGASDTTQVAIDVRNVKDYIKPDGNIAGIQSTPSTGGAPTMAAAQQFLIIEYPSNTAPTNPSAAFTASTTSGIIPFTVRFRDISNGPGITPHWDFNSDGITDSTERKPSYTFTSQGIYTVNLTVTNSYGTSTITKNITATLGAPITAFTAYPVSGDTPLTVQFADQSERFPTAWAWDFGDGNTSTDKTPSHTYPSAGQYTVRLTASNIAGSNTVTKTNYITVNAKVIVEKKFEIAGVTSTETGSEQRVSIDKSKATVSATGSVVTLKDVGNGWANMDLVMNDTQTAGSTITGTVREVRAVGENVTVPIPALGSPKVRLELALDKLPPSTASITETITQNPDSATQSSFSLAASSNNNAIDAIAYTVAYTKTGIANAAGGNGTIRNATVYFAISPAWVAANGGTSRIRILHMNDAGTTTILVPQFLGLDSDLNDLFSAVSEEGLSTFAIAAVSSVSSGGGGGGTDSSGSAAGFTSSKDTERKKGKVYDYPDTKKDLSYGTDGFQVTTVSQKGRVAVTPLKAAGAMPEAKASWSAEILNDPDGGGKISTGITNSIAADIVASYRSALARQDLDVAAVAYAMSVSKDNRIGDTRNAVIRMSAPQAWVTENGGEGQVRILRISDDGTAELLATSFSGYDKDSGYLTFQAVSPNGLCTFTLIAVKPLAAGSAAAASQTGASPMGNGSQGEAGILTETSPVGHGVTYNVIFAAILISGGCIGLAALYRMRKRGGI